MHKESNEGETLTAALVRRENSTLFLIIKTISCIFLLIFIPTFTPTLWHSDLFSYISEIQTHDLYSVGNRLHSSPASCMIQHKQTDPLPDSSNLIVQPSVYAAR